MSCQSFQLRGYSYLSLKRSADSSFWASRRQRPARSNHGLKVTRSTWQYLAVLGSTWQHLAHGSARTNAAVLPAFVLVLPQRHAAAQW
jgi:hypothetical protein